MDEYFWKRRLALDDEANYITTEELYQKIKSRLIEELQEEDSGEQHSQLPSQ